MRYAAVRMYTRMYIYIYNIGALTDAWNPVPDVACSFPLCALGHHELVQFEGSAKRPPTKNGLTFALVDVCVSVQLGRKLVSVRSACD